MRGGGTATLWGSAAGGSGVRPAADASEPPAPQPCCPTAPPSWLLWLDLTPRPGYLNMAIDETLLRLAETDGVGVLRLYAWAPPCLSFGRHEPAARRYVRERLARLGVDVVRRPTGGRAVWHARELTYAVAAPNWTFGTLAETYQRIHATLAAALSMLGARATLAPAPPRTAPLHAGACFATAAGGEVLVHGRKVVGSAQYRTQAAFLQHGSILLEGDQSLVAAVSVQPAPSSGEIALGEALGRPATLDETADAVALAARAWGTEWRTIQSGDAIVELAAPAADRYRSPEWTWRR